MKCGWCGVGMGEDETGIIDTQSQTSGHIICYVSLTSKG